MLHPRTVFLWHAYLQRTLPDYYERDAFELDPSWTFPRTLRQCRFAAWQNGQCLTKIDIWQWNEDEDTEDLVAERFPLSHVDDFFDHSAEWAAQYRPPIDNNRFGKIHPIPFREVTIKSWQHDDSRYYDYVVPIDYDKDLIYREASEADDKKGYFKILERYETDVSLTPQTPLQRSVTMATTIDACANAVRRVTYDPDYLPRLKITEYLSGPRPDTATQVYRAPGLFLFVHPSNLPLAIWQVWFN